MTDWSQVLEIHGRIVWKTVNRLIEDDTDAADCFQETFVAAFEYSRKHQIRNWPGLLKKLATTTALYRLRKRTRQTITPGSMWDALRSPTTRANRRKSQKAMNCSSDYARPWRPCRQSRRRRAVCGF